MTDSADKVTREQQLAQVFVSLTDTLIQDFDVADLFGGLANACVDLLQVTAAGLMLTDVDGRLRLVASSSNRSRLLELMEIQNDEGPCLDCHRDGVAVLVDDLDQNRDRWPRFATAATRVGFGAVYAIPMRLRQDTIGALNLFHQQTSTVTQATLTLAQALADVTTIAVLQQRAVRGSKEMSQHLQRALTTRLVIEQAKGVLAERLQVDVQTAFDLLRKQARSTSRQLSEVAQSVVSGELPAAEMRRFDTPIPGKDRPRTHSDQA